MSDGREYLSEDILDPSFVKCFAPIHIVQLVLGSTHTDIRHGFVMPTTRCQKLYTMAWFILCTYSNFYILYFYFTAYYYVDKTVYFSLTLGAFFQYINYVIIAIHTRFSGGEKTVNIYLQLQRIDRILKLNEIPLFNQKLFRYNCITVFIVLVVYLSGFLTYIFFCVDDGGKAIFIGFGFIIIYMEMVMTGSLIYYLGARLQHTNRVVKMNIDLKKENNADCSLDVKDAFNIVPVYESQNSDALDLRKVYVIIETILKTYRDVNMRFSVPVFILTLTVYFWSCLTIEGIVIGLNSGSLPWLAVSMIGLWLIFYYVQLLLLAITNDWFCRQLQQLKRMCVYALSVYHDGPVYHAAKDMTALLARRRPAFAVCGVWTLTLALPLSMLVLITNNAVILLQFTL